MQELLEGLEPTLPVLLSNLVTVNQVVRRGWPPSSSCSSPTRVIISSGFTGTPGTATATCTSSTRGSRRRAARATSPGKWRAAADLSDGPIYLKAHCASGAPYNLRGSKYAPEFGSPGGSNRVAPYDPRRR